MLATMLNCSPEILATSEEPFILYFRNTYGEVTQWEDKKIEAFVNDFFLLHDKNLKVYFSDKETTIANLMSKDRNVGYIDMCKNLYLNFYPDQDKSRVKTIIDKQIKFSYHPHLIEELVADAKFAVLVRNPLDSLSSWRKRKMGKSLNATYLADMWNDLYSILESFSKNNKRTIVIRYEDLVQKPEQNLQILCAHFGVEYTSDMLNFNNEFKSFTKDAGERDPNFSARLHDFHSGLHKPISNENIGIQDEFFSKEEQDVILTICEDTMRNLGYEVPEFTSRTEPNSDRLRKQSKKNRRKLLTIYLKTPFWAKKMARKVRGKKVDA